jgi:hypothetical protein
MKTIHKEQKRNYIKPVIERIRLDNEISMIMMSPPPDPSAPEGPEGPGLPFLSEHFSMNPFK